MTTAPSERLRFFALAAAVLGSALGFIDGSLVAIALPTIGADLGASLAELQWVQNGYLLALSAFIVVGGGLGDRLGRARVFSAGLILFAAASVWCALAPDAAQLIAARVVKGLGAAIMIPQSLALIADVYPKDQRGWAIGVWASASALTTAAGPALGGVIVDAFGWRAAFWVNAPLAAIALGVLALARPALKPVSANAAACLRLDWAGAAAVVIGLGALSWALIAGAGRGMDAPVVAALIVAVAAFALLPRIEARAAQPIAPPALFKSSAFLWANIYTVLLWGALAAVLFLLPFDLMGVRGLTPTEVGLILTPFAVVIGVFSSVAGRYADAIGPRPLLTAAGIVFTVAALALALTPMEGSAWLWSTPAVALLAGGMALAVAPLTTAALAAAPDGFEGAASGLNNAASRASGLIAVAAIGAVAAIVFSGAAEGGDFVDALQGSGGPDAAYGLNRAVAAGYFCCAALAAAAAVAARKLPPKEATPAAA